MSDGVIYHKGPLPPMAPGPIASQLKAIVHRSLGELAPGQSGASLEVTSDAGTNLVIAHRDPKGTWQVDLWIGKTWGKDPLSFGVSGKVLW